MSPEQALADKIKAEYPNLVIEISGPWDREAVWLANFKDVEFSYKYIHPGSSGATMMEALEKGYEAVLEWANRMQGPAPL